MSLEVHHLKRLAVVPQPSGINHGLGKAAAPCDSVNSGHCPIKRGTMSHKIPVAPDPECHQMTHDCMLTRVELGRHAHHLRLVRECGLDFNPWDTHSISPKKDPLRTG
jgi:hypothetical protein